MTSSTPTAPSTQTAPSSLTISFSPIGAAPIEMASTCPASSSTAGTFSFGSGTGSTSGSQPTIGSLFGRDVSLSHNVTDYQKTDLRSHIYDIPDTYLGDAMQRVRSAMLLDMSEPGNYRVVGKTINFPDGEEQTFLEILTNAGDNVIASRSAGINPGKIQVTVDRQRVTIRNNGRLIPIEIHPKEGIYVPEMILGTLLTSSNYDTEKERCGAGRNGYGAKITNIFSKEFSVEIGDPSRHQLYRQVWRNNMLEREDPTITDGYRGTAYVEISYVIDHQRFGYTEYPDEAFGVFANHCANIAFTQQVPVLFNGVELKCRDLASYTKYQFGKDANYVIHRQWGPEVEMVHKRGGMVAKDSNIQPIIQVALIDTPNKSRLLAFTNGLINPDGGVHVDATIRAIQTPILTQINKATSKGRGKSTAKGKSATSTGAPRLTAQHFKRHISMIVTYQVINPKFDSQGKRKLTGTTKRSTPLPKISIDEKWFKPIRKWRLMHCLVKEMQMLIDRRLTATDGKRRGRPNIEKADHANWAGKSVAKNRQCTLVLTEGDSAMTFAVKLFSKMGGRFRDIYGFFPLRGKLINVREGDALKIANNQEITAIKQMLRLQEGTDYTLPTNRDKLAYHHILIITDPDVDGEHIKGLIINYFDVKFPGVLVNGMVQYMRLPIVQVNHQGRLLKFYTAAAVQQWESTLTRKIPHDAYRYFKGLGTFNKEDVDEEYVNMYIVSLSYDRYAADNINLLFNKHLAGSRKDLIEQYQPDASTERYTEQSISHLMRRGVLGFSVADVQRSIPHFSGLKDVQNKIVYAAFKIWGAKVGKKSGRMKVAQFAPRTSTITLYEHGEESVVKAVTAMAQDFPGSNNLPLFFPDGQFGSRRKNGKDAASGRYIYTYPQWSMPLIFSRKDEPILVHRVDEGKELEWVRYRPILPLVLINGQLGIATGFSTYIPPHNPMDICAWLALRIRDLNRTELETELKPWFRGFRGPVEIIVRKPGEQVSSSSAASSSSAGSESFVFSFSVVSPDDESTSDEDLPSTSVDMFGTTDSMGDDHIEFGFDSGTRRRKQDGIKRSVVIKGTYRRIGEDTVIVDEIPVGRGINSYKNWLEQLVKDKQIKSYDNHSTDNVPNFTIHGFKNPSHRRLKLWRSFGISNMVLLDDRGIPRYYETVVDILETFYHQRLRDYEARKEVEIKERRDAIQSVDYMIALIIAVVEDRLIVKRRPKADIHADMAQLGIPSEYLKKVGLHRLSIDEIAKLRAKRADLEAKLAEYIQIHPSSIWEAELTNFVAAYLKHYPEDVHRLGDPGLVGTFLAPWAARADPSQIPTYGAGGTRHIDMTRESGPQHFEFGTGRISTAYGCSPQLGISDSPASSSTDSVISFNSATTSPGSAGLSFAPTTTAQTSTMSFTVC